MGGGRPNIRAQYIVMKNGPPLHDIFGIIPKKNLLTPKASGSDGIPVELFQILKDDAVKVLHSICQQIWKTQ